MVEAIFSMKAISIFFVVIFSVTLIYSLHTSTINNTGLVSAWHLDEGSGTAARDSVAMSTNTATVLTPVWITGRDHFALNFNGSSDYMQIFNQPYFSAANNGISYFVSVKICI